MSTLSAVSCVDSRLGTGFRSEYRYSKNTQKSVLTAAPLFRVTSEFIQNELNGILCKAMHTGVNKTLVLQITKTAFS